MSLNYNLTKIENYKELCWLPWVEGESPPLMFTGGYFKDDNGDTRYMNPKTHQIIFRCMPVGIGVVSERTIPEFWARNVVWLALRELKQDFSLEDLRQHTGLSTNVFPEESRSKWVKRIIGGHLDDIRRQVNYDIKKDVESLNI